MANIEAPFGAYRSAPSFSNVVALDFQRLHPENDFIGYVVVHYAFEIGCNGEYHRSVCSCLCSSLSASVMRVQAKPLHVQGAKASNQYVVVHFMLRFVDSVVWRSD